MPDPDAVLDFQYSLRIVGFCDVKARSRPFKHDDTFSIPCESWGSATGNMPRPAVVKTRTFSIPCESWGSATFCRRPQGVSPWIFQYSLRIVGFCDQETHMRYVSTSGLSVFPANRGVLRLLHTANTCKDIAHLSVFPANRGVLRQKGYTGPFWVQRDFQYSLRIVGFCDYHHLCQL